MATQPHRASQLQIPMNVKDKCTLAMLIFGSLFRLELYVKVYLSLKKIEQESRDRFDRLKQTEAE